MSECKLDHSFEDVRKKLESQQPSLPGELYGRLENYLTEERTQDLLNELFHLLKKYDLASEEEKEVRNNRLEIIVRN
ncbi:hypothetical protein [Domibacillus indicus]|uniref:hypothetical protein n=1 Tax=Domibacillus indicus TaxID=1437523 RepID=UPI000618050C|nr:hypothetical protein [Domibacillus indicus]